MTATSPTRLPWIVFGIVLAGTACKPARIRGVVTDAHGRALTDVVIKVANTAFGANSTITGGYELDYAAGEFTVTWQKAGYTTVSRTFNVAQRTSLPADTVALFQIPESRWMHYLSADTVYPLSSSSVRRDRSGAIWQYREKVFAELTAPNVVAPGRVRFIDRDANPLKLVRVGDDGLIGDAVYGIGDVKDYYNGWLDDSVSRVGAESLLVRTVWLKDGRYAWVPIQRDPGGAGHVGDFVMMFQVVDSAIAADAPSKTGPHAVQAGQLVATPSPVAYNTAFFGYIAQGQTLSIPFRVTEASPGCSAGSGGQCEVYVISGARPDSGVSLAKLREHYSLNKDVADVKLELRDMKGRVVTSSSRSSATMFGHNQELSSNKIPLGDYTILVTGVGGSGRFSVLWTRRIEGN